jgi:DNA-binding NarL/FixJ family response regulator
MLVSKVRVLLVDDHALFREGLAGILNSQPDFTVVGEAADGLEAVVMARKLLPDLVLMDVAMPGCDGVEATVLLKQELPAVVVVMLTMFDEDEKLFEAIKCGAQGYLLKSIHAGELLALLRGAMQGEAAVTPVLSSRILEEFRHLSRGQPETPPPTELALTARENEVMRLVAGGATDKEIAAELVISIHTVKSHVRSVLTKLHLTHRHEAARYLVANRRIPPRSTGDG